MICGHDRETLQWALTTCKDERYVTSTIDCKDMVNPYPDGARMDDAMRTVCDPAKLAAIIAELMRERGIDARAFTPKGGLCVFAYMTEFDDIVRRCIDLPDARAFALRLLDATTATAQDVEHMIGEL